MNRKTLFVDRRNCWSRLKMKSAHVPLMVWSKADSIKVKSDEMLSGGGII